LRRDLRDGTRSAPPHASDPEPAPQQLENFACKSDADLDDLREEGYVPGARCELHVSIIAHEEARYYYTNFRTAQWGCEWYGPVAVRAVFVDPESGIDFHADVTEEIVASIPERLGEKQRQQLARAARAKAEGWEFV